MDREALLGDVLVHLADGTVESAAPILAERWSADGDAALAALAGVAAFWCGAFAEATAWAERAVAAADDAQTRALALAARSLAAAGDLAAGRDGGWEEASALLAAAPDPAGRPWTAVRYLLAESALVDARLDDARSVAATGPLPGDAWDGHPFAAVMHACAVRVAAFGGGIDRAAALVPGMRAATLPGSRLATVVDAVAGLVQGNAADASSVAQSVAVADQVPVVPRDFVDRGVLLLLAFGAIAVGDTRTAAALTLRAGTDGDLAACTAIDRALGLELLLVAALEEEDAPAAAAWLAAVEALAAHPAAAPTVDRCRSRAALAAGDVASAVSSAEASVAACRRDGRAVEAAEGEILLARARIAGRDLAEASRSLRALVAVSDATGHHAVRRSAASALGPARRRLPPVAGGRWAALSAREAEVARLVLAGGEVEEIAAALFLSPATVRLYVSRVLCAFGAATRVGLLAAVGAEGGLEPGEPPAALSPRQAQVARLVAGGASNRQIADELGISVKGGEARGRRTRPVGGRVALRAGPDLVVGARDFHAAGVSQTGTRPARDRHETGTSEKRCNRRRLGSPAVAWMTLQGRVDPCPENRRRESDGVRVGRRW